MAEGWILGDGANLNGVPLTRTLRGFGDRMIWEFRRADDAQTHNVSSVDLIRGGATVENAPRRLRRQLQDLSADNSLSSADFITLWLTPEWEPNWFSPSELQSALDQGITPVFLDWFFGDGLLNIDPRIKVPPLLDDYADHSRRFGQFLGQFDGDILIVVEPELNKPAIEQWPEFGEVIRTYGVEEIRQGAREINALTGRRTNLFFGVALTDNGLRRSDMPDDVYGTKAHGDSYGWTLSRPLLEVLRPDLDFVGFQQILSQFHRNPDNPDFPMANTPEDIGLREFPERILNYARYLDEQLGIPVFIPYVAVPTSSWVDENGNALAEDDEIRPLGWEEEAGLLLRKLNDLQSDLFEANVMGLGTMLLFDDPVHDLGGYQYLLQNEYAIGLVTTDARNAVPSEKFGTALSHKTFRRRSFVEWFFDH